ncbi:MAG: glycoside hydrolase family 97 protein, partial [Flavobacterium sp.]
PLINSLSILALIFVSLNNAKAIVPSLKLLSPNKKVQILLNIGDNGNISYQVLKDGKKVLNDSQLGLKLKEVEGFETGWKILSEKRKSFNENWTTVWGPDKMINNSYNELTVNLQKQNKYLFNITFRVFNNGVGFRYEVPNQKGIKDINLVDELTEFAFAENLTSWSIPQNFATDELIYTKQPIAEVKNANTPITMAGDSYACAIHEAALIDFAQMTLVKKGDLTFKADLVAWPDGIKVKAVGKMISPWRTILIESSAPMLISSHVVENLNEPLKIKDTSWIKPGKYIGIWWEMHLGTSLWFPKEGAIHGANTQHMKDYIDFAAKNNITGVLAEGWNLGWEKRKTFSFKEGYPDYDLPYLAKYAHDKGVDIVVHNETASNIPSFEAQMEEAFSYYEKLGIHYIKTGYIGQMTPVGMLRHGQYMVNHYRKVIETAAKHHIMVIAHEPIMDTGERRTYPNMFSREGVRGMEFEAWSEGNTPTHTTTLPFTRGLAGPIDYNPGIFDILFKNTDPTKLRTFKIAKPIGIVRVHSTLAYQLALFNIYYTPMQMAPDLIENYENQPAFKLIRDMKATWDETVMLDGKVGEYLVLARRSGNEWFLSAITNETARTLEVNLSAFLKSGDYDADTYKDPAGTDWLTKPDQISINSGHLKERKITINLPAGGGYSMKIYPSKK